VYIGGDADIGGLVKFDKASGWNATAAIANPNLAGRKTAYVTCTTEVGGDLYAGGSIDQYDSGWEIEEGYTCYWKNGVLVHQFPDITDIAYSYAKGIFVVP
jgi:hypothetical protein